MTITVIGAGYVGLTVGTIFAEQGHTVWVVRRDEKKIQDLKRGVIPFYEPGIEEIVRRNITNGRLRPTTSFSDSVPTSDIVFICVGTPPLADGRADLSQVFAATEEIARNLKPGYTVVVNKSTVPIGTAVQVNDILQRCKSADAQCSVASCPEFLREGSAVHDTMNPDRIIIGTEDERARQLLESLHSSLGGERVYCNIKTAEMIKYASNSLLATEISFINSIASLCERVGANVEDVARGMKLDKRIGRYAFLDAGCGYGGSCFPKDVKALVQMAREHGSPLPLLEAVESVNEMQKSIVYRKLCETIGSVRGKTIAIWGIAFKPKTDDIREAPALRLIDALLHNGARVVAYDRVAEENARVLFPDVTYCPEPMEAVANADALCILTEWEEFRWPDMQRMREHMKFPVIIDGRNLYSPTAMHAMGFTYKSIGRPSV